MILIVEDNPQIVDMFKEELTEAGYEVEYVLTGTDALACFNRREYQLALMDLSLPDLNGAEVTCQARAAGNTTPVIAVTGALPLIDPSKLAAAGFAAVIAKPLRISELMALVKIHAREPV